MKPRGARSRLGCRVTLGGGAGAGASRFELGVARAPGGADGGDRSPDVAAGQRLARPLSHPCPLASWALQRALTHSAAPRHPRPLVGVERKGPPPAGGTCGEDLGASCPWAALGLSARDRPWAVLGGKVQEGKGTLCSECHSPTRSRLTSPRLPHPYTSDLDANKSRVQPRWISGPCGLGNTQGFLFELQG